MPNVKITGLSATTALVAADLVEVVTDVAGTPTSGKASVATLQTAVLARTLNAQTGITYTFVLGDANNIVTANNAAASTFTVPPNSSVAYPTLSELSGTNLGAGSMTLAPGSGVTLTPEPGVSLVVPTGGTWNAQKLSTDTWSVLTTSRIEALMVAVGDETTAITTGLAKVTFRMPYAMILTSIPRASLTTASSSGLPTFNIKEAGVTIFSTKITIDATELTSVTAATAAVLSDSVLASDAEITIDIDVAGTGAKGPKIALFGIRS